MSGAIKFGTDGWRGIIAEDFTFDNVRICAQATANYLKKAGPTNGGLVIGYDTRFDSEEFAAATAEVIMGNGIKVLLCPAPTPTPVISFAIPRSKAVGGIIITASHNPAQWNGFKLKTADGGSAPHSIVSLVEAEIAGVSGGDIRRLPFVEAQKAGMLSYWDVAPEYNKHLESLIDLKELRRHRLNVIVDVMFGAGAGYLSSLLSGGKIKVNEINSERNPVFPGMHQPEPIARNLTKLISLIVQSKADVGLANDGDADRIGVIDEKGEYLNPHQIFALLTLYFLEVRGERGAIVKTVSSTEMLDRLGQIFNVPVFETAVGFPNIAPLMLKENALIGGEESGGYGFRGHVPERDGILAALYLLDFMVKTRKSPSELVRYLYGKVGTHYYDRDDYPLPPEKKRAILDRCGHYPDSFGGSKVLEVKTTDGFRFSLEDGSWLLLRFSGTEPLVRLYAESTNKEKLRKILDDGKKLLGG